MAIQSFVTPLLLFSFLVGSALGGVLLSGLPQTVEVRTLTQEHGERSALGGVLLSDLPQTVEVRTPTQQPGETFKAGKDMLTVTWRTFPGAADEKYKTVKFMLCFAPISQNGQPWRKTKDNITEDKSCKSVLVSKPYYKKNIEETFHWLIKKDVPTATYFIRAYALNATGIEVAYGQSTDDHKTINLFQIKGISSWIPSFSIVAVCCTAFTLVAVFGFIICEKRRSRARSRSRNTASVIPL